MAMMGLKTIMASSFLGSMGKKKVPEGLFIHHSLNRQYTRLTNSTWQWICYAWAQDALRDQS